jgi:hypothetical protein
MYSKIKYTEEIRMFSHMNAAMPLFPQQQFCIEFTGYNPCWYYGGTYHPCGWYYNTYFPCVALTTRTVIEQQVACQAGTQPVPGQIPVGDPIEQLQALRRQLEVTMAGLEAQERVLRAQQDASRAQQDASRAHGTAPEKK